jgi:hypothetical protein
MLRHLHPIVGETPIVGAATGRVLDEEMRRLDGVETAVVRASNIEAEAFGFDLLNMAKVSTAVDAGRVRAAREAERLTRVWPRR